MKLTSKGQLTIPHAFRTRYGLLPDTEVIFEAAEGGVLIKPAAATRRRRMEKAVTRVRGRARTGRNTDEIMRLTRGE